MNIMFDDLKLRPSTPDLLRYFPCMLALLLVCAPFTIGAIWAFPIYDDASIWLLLKEKGVGAIAANSPDRPLKGSLLSLVATSEHAYWHTAFLQ